jgi:hypothetical protein
VTHLQLGIQAQYFKPQPGRLVLGNAQGIAEHTIRTSLHLHCSIVLTLATSFTG